ncbi:MAG: TetR/AcrR family transcriptional regulator [Firmicutes bacterium]|nr:TetR/AcrR family transcriptional regulator [Bacillota bacterium]
MKEQANEAKIRILDAATILFAEKGFDAARVDDIAKAAKVNKALIYYYFDGKKDILNQLLQALLDRLAVISMEFIEQCIVTMIKQQRLDIVGEKFAFVDQKAADDFHAMHQSFIHQVVNLLLENAPVVRILMLESLKQNKKQNYLFQFLSLLQQSYENPLYCAIHNADADFSYSEETKFLQFFFTLMPLVNIAAYFDEYRKINALAEEEMKEMIYASYQTTIDGIRRRYVVVKGDFTDQ